MAARRQGGHVGGGSVQSEQKTNTRNESSGDVSAGVSETLSLQVPQEVRRWLMRDSSRRPNSKR